MVLAAGSVPYNPLQSVLESRGISCTAVGDARRVGTAFDAIHQGFEAGRTI